MEFALNTAEVFVPDGTCAEEALARTTHMAVGAHQDDLEIMACHGILACLEREDRWFCGVVVTDGGGSPRNGPYAGYTDDEMRAIRRREQEKAAVIGEYGSQVFLDYPSSAVRDASKAAPVEDLRSLLEWAAPHVVYTHNLADRHDTHVATALRVVEAVQSLAPRDRPSRLYGCEVWRSLDWLADEDKVALDVSARDNLQRALLGVFDSQISGGKRYDLATMGRRRANATYCAARDVDLATGMTYAVDMTSLMEGSGSDVRAHVRELVDRFREDVTRRVAELQ